MSQLKSEFIQLIVIQLVSPFSSLFKHKYGLSHSFVPIEVSLGFAAGTQTSKALNRSIRKLFVVPPSACAFRFLIQGSCRQMLFYQNLLQHLNIHQHGMDPHGKA